MGISLNAIILIHLYLTISLYRDQSIQIDQDEIDYFKNNSKDYSKLAVNGTSLVVERVKHEYRGNLSMNLFLSLLINKGIEKPLSLWERIDSVESDDKKNNVFATTYKIPKDLKLYLKNDVFPKTNISIAGIINFAILLSDSNLNKETIKEPIEYYENLEMSEQFIRISIVAKEKLKYQASECGNYTESELLRHHIENMLDYLAI